MGENEEVVRFVAKKGEEYSASPHAVRVVSTRQKTINETKSPQPVRVLPTTPPPKAK